MNALADQLEKDLPKLAREVAAALGDLPGREWQHDIGWPGFGERISGPSDRFITLTVPYNTRGQVEISGSYPAGSSAMYDLKHFEITVRADRGAEVIAKEITRRLMPDYLAELARLKVWLANQADRAERQRQLADRISVATDLDYRHVGQTYMFHYYRQGGLSFRLEVSTSSTIRVEHLYDSEDVILPGILAMIAADDQRANTE